MKIKQFKLNDFVIRTDDNDNDLYLRDAFAQISEKKVFSSVVKLDDGQKIKSFNKKDLEGSEWVNFETFKKDFVKNQKLYTHLYGGMDTDPIYQTQIIQLGTSHNKCLAIVLDKDRWRVELYSENILSEFTEVSDMQELLEKHIDMEVGYIKPLPSLEVDDYDGSKWLQQPSDEEFEHARKQSEDRKTLSSLNYYTNNFQKVENLVHTVLNDDVKLHNFMEFNLVGKYLSKYVSTNTTRFEYSLNNLFELEEGNQLIVPQKYVKQIKESQRSLKLEEENKKINAPEIEKDNKSGMVMSR